jgi:trigger factor
LKVSTEKIPESQVLMTIEVEPERLDAAREKALRKLAPRAKVPGFRPGKAPKNMVLSYFGEERVLDEALDVLVPDVYREALEADESIDAIARPRLVVETTEPLVVKATIPVRPTVELGDYQSVRVAAEPIVVEESRVEETLQVLRKRSATLEPIERAIAWTDVVRIDVLGTVEGEKMVDQKDVEVQLAEDRDVLFPGFEEALLGHKKGEAVEFTLAVPEEVKSEKFAGKQCDFVVNVTETKEEILPELDDAFVKAVGEGFETVDALRQRIREDIGKVQEQQRDNRYHEEILTQLVERATIEFPPVMLDVEVDRLVHEHARQIGDEHNMEGYLASIGKTAEEVREELRPIADTRLRRSLVLSQLTGAENIEAADEEIEAEIDKMTASAGQQAAQLRQLFDSENGRDTIRRNLQTKKTLARLVEIATQDGGVAAATGVPADKPAPKKRAAKTKAKATAAAVSEPVEEQSP